MAEISFDSLNIYVKNKVPTDRYVKAFLILLNLAAIMGLFYFAIALQEDGPNPVLFLIPVLYVLSLGRYIAWNIFGEELLIISTSHLSYQHVYGLRTTKLKSLSYDLVAPDQSGPNIKTADHINLKFIAIDEQKLSQEVFVTTIALTVTESERILKGLNEMKIEEWGNKVNFPTIFPN